MTDTQCTEKRIENKTEIEQEKENKRKRRGTRSHTGPSNRFVLQASRISEDDHEHSNKEHKARWM